MPILLPRVYQAIWRFPQPIAKACQRNCTYEPALCHYRRHPFGMFSSAACSRILQQSTYPKALYQGSKIYAHPHRALNGVFSQSDQCTARVRQGGHV
jgi:hypothetical protein